LLILGTNLTQDRIVRLATLVPGAVLRAVSVDTVPGGKPVNVARVAVRTAGTLRTATIVLEGDGRTTVINEPGPPLDDAGRTAFLDAYVDTLAGQRPQVVVASGSLPPGHRRTSTPPSSGWRWSTAPSRWSTPAGRSSRPRCGPGRRS
jgi:fructose-1-phosphate kinase PfkB-like protein